MTGANLIETQGMLISQGDEEMDPNFDGFKPTAFTALFSGKKV